MSHTLVIGGGVIGLSIAYELSRRQHRVTLLEKNLVGRATSWAGAGILPPANANTAIHPLEKLEALSNNLHSNWAATLQSATGIDTGFRMCGGLYLARTPGEVAALNGQQFYWEQREIEFRILNKHQLLEFLPDRSCVHKICHAVFVPGESQLRSPRLLQALESACRKNGVAIVEQIGSIELEFENEDTKLVRAGSRTFFADQYCIAAGVWSERLLAPFMVPLPSIPVRGQMVLFKLDHQNFTPIINEGTRYLVPRDDGHVLAGATIEEVGFNSDTEAADIAELIAWALEWVPQCCQQTFVKSWAGLRPGTYDGFPYLGAIGKSKNTWIATGHFKSGLQLSTGTAVVMADLIEARESPIDLAPFAPQRILKASPASGQTL